MIQETQEIKARHGEPRRTLILDAAAGEEPAAAAEDLTEAA